MKLENVTVGTTLGYSAIGEAPTRAVDVVTVSRREVTCSDGFRYLRSTGRRYGSVNDPEAPTVSLLTGEVAEKVRLHELARSTTGRAMVIHNSLGRSGADAETVRLARVALEALARELTEALGIE